jgi:DNA helicase-2/ATP-dependent DNA helicase PcrA
VADEEAMLRKLLENYRMSPTHLNNFLDVPNGGPAHFIEQSLLHFPQAKAPSLSYGTAMHGAIEDVYKHLRSENELPKTQYVLEHFREILLKERLSKLDHDRWRVQGEDALAAYYGQKKDTFGREDIIEKDFRHEGVVIGEAHLTGKIDKIVPLESEALVVDLKTGQPAEKWKGKNDNEKQKLRRYQNQLLFYKLLVEHSERYGGKYTVNSGKLEYLEPIKDTKKDTKKDKNEFCELELDFEGEQIERLKNLIEIVYGKIMNLDFPDVSGYSQDVKGVEAFEEDLLAGKI